MSNTPDPGLPERGEHHPSPAATLVSELAGFPRRMVGFVRMLGVKEERAHRLVDGVLASLGLGKDTPRPPPATPSDTGTRLAFERTDLAMERTYWAAERTLMGWVRTALSMISFGFTIGKLGQVVQIEVRGLKGLRTVGAGTIAYLLVIVGTLALLAAALQYSLRVQEFCQQGLRRQPSIAFVVAVLLFLLGVGAFSSLVLKL
ncbi:MAG: DUF202 domain-containing protein [Lentisphaerae bacterium]|nr:DUF202 domain-containing protein [Lentisphaerota bacterium]